MNWHSQTVVFCLWGAQPILQAAVALIFWRRKLYRQFPAFYWYLLAQIVNFAVIFPLWLTGSRTLYFWFFWLGEAVNAVLGFKVIHEIFLDVFRPYHTLKDLGTLLFKWAGVVLLLLALVVAFSNSLDHDPLVDALATLQRSVRVVQVGLVIFLLLFSRFLGVSRRQICFGISLGFGLLASVDLILMVLNSGGFVAQDNLNLIDMATCNLAILVWFGYSLARKAVSQATVNHLQTQRWEQSLADLQTPEASDSLIPMFEGMVERALLRNSNLEPAEDVPRPDQSFTRPRASSAVAGSKTQR
jgi:hypothetical protein